MSSSNTFPISAQEHLEFYATCGGGLAGLLASEFKALNFSQVQTAGAGVRFFGTLAEGYRACLWSRLANRVLLPIHKGPAASPEALYERVQEIDWSEHMSVDGSLAVDFFTANSEITHSQYGALKVKDAVVDQFRDKHDRRPDVDRNTPDVRINVYLFRDQARIAIDLSGSSLHRRGYRGSGGLAPLKENLAAAILLASGWPEAVEEGSSLYDPLCGSGTLLIEAALIATNRAPGLSREYFGFLGWKQHDDIAWQQLLTEANDSIRLSQVLIAGSDQDREAIDACRANLEAAGVDDCVEVYCQSLDIPPPASAYAAGSGQVITNPPYGERLAADTHFYKSLGGDLSRYFGGWMCSLFTASAAPYARARLPLSTLLSTRNGGIDCVLLQGQIPAARVKAREASPETLVGASTDELIDEVDSPESPLEPPLSGDSEDNGEHPQAALYRSKQEPKESVSEYSPEPNELDVDVLPFINRVRKNQRNLKGWLKQNKINAYRLYDADLPEFAVAVDIISTDTTHCVVQEYQAPATVNLAMAEARLEALVAALPDALNIPEENLHLKVRSVKSGDDQYRRLAAASSSVVYVQEHDAKLELNLTDYLDIGLFLDHRPVRRYIYQQASGKRFLNLFSYTATATVAAACGGAHSSVSVDSSNRYSQWAKRNLDNNQAAAQLHEVVRQDVFTWLASASVGLSADKLFDLVLLDPPTFSNSTDHEEDWNVQRDHVKAIDACLSVMAPGALLIFSNNYRRFKIDEELVNDTVRGIKVEDRSRWSIDRDFTRNPRIHQCWFIYKQ